MEFNVKNLVRENINSLTPYSSARDEFTGEASIFLDANENPYDTSVNRYPDPHQKSVKQSISKLKDVPKDNIFLGNGSDEVIDLLFRAFCKPSVDNVITLPPTYGMYKVCASINDIQTAEVQLTERFQPDATKILSTINDKTKLIFICSPNNPTGNLIEKSIIEEILSGFNGLVIVDEAYIDYAPGNSILPLLTRFENLVVLQTFSKAWGLAGIRLGMAFASKTVVEILNKIKPPYNIDSLSQSIALKAAQRGKPEMLNEQIKQRQYVTNELRELKFVKKIYPSNANFLLVEFEDPKKIREFLVKNEIVVRDRSNQPMCEGCLRISIGTPSENKKFIEVLKDFKK